MSATNTALASALKAAMPAKSVKPAKAPKPFDIESATVRTYYNAEGKAPALKVERPAVLPEGERVTTDHTDAKVVSAALASLDGLIKAVRSATALSDIKLSNLCYRAAVQAYEHRCPEIVNAVIDALKGTVVQMARVYRYFALWGFEFGEKHRVVAIENISAQSELQKVMRQTTVYRCKTVEDKAVKASEVEAADENNVGDAAAAVLNAGIKKVASRNKAIAATPSESASRVMHFNNKISSRLAFLGKINALCQNKGIEEDDKYAELLHWIERAIDDNKAIGNL